MENEKLYKIKYIPTENVFELSKSECDKLVIEEPHNFKVIDAEYPTPEFETVQSSIEVSILGDTGNAGPQQTEVTPYKDTSVWKNKSALEEECKKRNIDFSSAKTRGDLEDILLADDTQKA